MPFTPPISLVNRLSLRPFNWAYFNLKKNAGREVVHYAPFFYPLDNLLEWNRMYGPAGFYQYQSVVPRSVGRDAIGAMLREISRSGEGSFLAVLKTFGSQPSVGMLGFRSPGLRWLWIFRIKARRRIVFSHAWIRLWRRQGGEFIRRRMRACRGRCLKRGIPH